MPSDMTEYLVAAGFVGFVAGALVALLVTVRDGSKCGQPCDGNGSNETKRDGW